ncbi:MAG: hypothetical protein L6R42_010410, partial [Xanthoria sp. 1 TBL-2021]
YKQPLHRVTATKPQKRSYEIRLPYPAPLILPSDELALDPTYPPQSVRSWQRDEDRNTSAKGDEHNQEFYAISLPTGHPRHSLLHLRILPPSLHQNLPYSLTFTTWEDAAALLRAKSGRTRVVKRKHTVPSYIAIRSDVSKTQIGTRASSPDALFPTRLNLNDLSDLAVDILPNDAYALLLHVSQDLYEDDLKVFACGRAYGGSRVAVVSTAPYNPDLDRIQNVTSHCAEYTNVFCDATKSPRPSSVMS